MRIILYASIVTLLILFPEDTAAHAAHAMRIWGENLVPTLFPYMVFSRMLSQNLRTLRLSTIPATACLGIMGGSPTGAMLIAAVSSRLSRRSLHTLCALSGTISPMFILGTLQTWTNDASLCRILLATHWTSALLCAAVVWILERNTREIADAGNPLPMQRHSTALTQSIDAILQVGGCVICYSVLAGFLEKILPVHSSLYPLLHAALEISGGTHAIWQGAFPLKTKAYLISSALGFGGISILAQNHALLNSLGLSMKRLLFFSVLRSACSLLCAVFLFST